jgi:uncharacterized RDD family membrane protein YckC
MDNIRIQTTQNVDINYELASIGDRILATLLDYLFFIVYVLMLVLIAWAARIEEEGLIVMSIAALPLLFYDLLCEMIFNGKSFGKMIMKIKVVKLDGTQPGFGAYLLRWVLRLIDTRLFSPGVALVVILINGKGQRLGDMAAGTTVIKMKQKISLSDTILNKVRPDYKIVFPEVAKLSDNDIDVIKDVMRQSITTGNQEVVTLLAAKIKATMGVNTAMQDVQFLATVVQDYSQYSFDK